MFTFRHGRKVAEICCTSIVYATEKKQTKVEFPEARIYEEALNILLYEGLYKISNCFFFEYRNFFRAQKFCHPGCWYGERCLWRVGPARASNTRGWSLSPTVEFQFTKFDPMRESLLKILLQNCIKYPDLVIFQFFVSILFRLLPVQKLLQSMFFSFF